MLVVGNLAILIAAFKGKWATKRFTSSLSSAAVQRLGGGGGESRYSSASF
jgi:hypothetical protein